MDGSSLDAEAILQMVVHFYYRKRDTTVIVLILISLEHQTPPEVHFFFWQDPTGSLFPSNSDKVLSYPA